MGASVKRKQSADVYTGVADILPSQHFSKLRSPCAGEQALMVAVLEDAIKIYKKHAFARYFHTKALFDETRSWILSDDFGWLYSYRRICETLDIDPSKIRKWLARWFHDQCGEGREDVLHKSAGIDQH